jgi:hypothetical protein
MLKNDNVKKEDKKMYGSKNLYMIMEKSGKRNGVFIINRNDMEVIIKKDKQIKFRNLGGIMEF